MIKNLIISTDYLFDENFINILKNNSQFNYLIITRDREKGEYIINKLSKEGISADYIFRSTRNINIDFEAIIGNKEVDFYLATYNKKLIFYDENSYVEPKVKQYGFPYSINELDKLLKILSLNKEYFCSLDIEEYNLHLLSLLDARTRVSVGYSEDEKSMIKDFEDLIKRYKRIKNGRLLIYYILLAIRNLPLEKPDFIFYFPSSTIGDNLFMKFLVESLRNVFHLSIKEEELLKRSKTITPSKTLSYDERIDCYRHFNSIEINKQHNLEDKVVWILDDYSTNGTSFEVVRNLLKNKNVKKIIFISIGNFGKKYLVQEFNDFKLLKRVSFSTILNTRYMSTLDSLADILNS